MTETRSEPCTCHSHTIVSVTGSSITTIAGFVALCFMSFTLGLDLGIVMAKGVVFGVIGCVTILPALILACDKAIEKTKHKILMPDVSRIASWVTNHYKILAVIFIVVLIPAIYGYTHDQSTMTLQEPCLTVHTVSRPMKDSTRSMLWVPHISSSHRAICQRQTA